MTAEEFLRLPEDPAVCRRLIDGTVWEAPASFHSLPHSTSLPRIGTALWDWAKRHDPDGEAGSGGAGVRLPGRETVLDVDVVLFAAADANPPAPADDLPHIWHAVPRVAAEVLEPMDSGDELAAKLREYRIARVPAVWVVDPVRKTLTVHRPDGPARTYQGDDPVPGGAALPGLDVRAGDLFER